MIFVIDGNNFCFRAGIVGDLTDENGSPTGVIYVALKMLKRLVDEYHPSLILVVWDGGKSEWRQKIYPEYKQRRRKSHVEDSTYQGIITQINELHNIVFSSLPIIQWREEGFEADDLVYSAVKVLYEKDKDIYVVSTDKDMYQLLNKCSILRFADEVAYTKRDFLKEFNFPVKDWVRYRALIGDTSDEIRGVDGVGKVTAQKIYSEFGSVEEFCKANQGKKVAEKLTNGKDIFERNVLLMDMKKLPGRTKLRKILRKKLKVMPKFAEHRLRSFCMGKQMFSIMRDWQVWKKHFIDLQESTKTFLK